MKRVNLVMVSTALVAATILAGCQSLQVTSRLAPDGGGQRTVVVELDGPQEEEGLTPEQMRGLYGIATERGWRPRGGGSADALPDAYVLARDIPDLAGWQQTSGDLRIVGDLEGGDEVVFASAVNVVEGWFGDARTLVYRETFAWSGLQDVIAEHLDGRVRRILADRWPDLPPEDRGEIRGLLRAGAGLQLVRLGESDDDRAVEMARQQSVFLTEQILAVVRRSAPQVSAAEVEQLVSAVLRHDEDEELERFLGDHYPGALLAAFAVVEVRLALPGTVLEHNADRVVEGELIWDVDPWQTATEPRTLRAICWPDKPGT